MLVSFLGRCLHWKLWNSLDNECLANWMLSSGGKAWMGKKGLFNHCEILIYVFGDLGLDPIEGEWYSAAGDI